LIDDEEDEAKEEQEIQKLKERVHKRNYLVCYLTPLIFIFF